MITNPSGRIELIIGPMFAGKTTEMLRRVDRAELAHKKCVIMKYSKDNRYSLDSVATHDLETRPAISCRELMVYFTECMNYDVIGVDEAQFFSDVVEFSERLANNGKVVIVAGLDGTFQRKPFGHILNLISRCEILTKLSAVCTETGRDAPFSQRIVNNTEIELIGGADMYRAASRASYFHSRTRGEIHLTIGPVNSGKTTELMRILKRHQYAGKRLCLITTKDMKGIEKYNGIVTKKLPKVDDLKDYQVIGVDEGQRFKGLGDWADALANEGKLVEISSLDASDSTSEPFDEIMSLIPRCEEVTKLDSVCPITGLPAPFSVFISGMRLVPMSRVGLLQNNQIPA
ncbi:thymidine kinase family protein [Tritrichomonas foetus]|uniref:thymidine kinase n=1 Tax=Tritrichomonas foetus TaxID=1144522 RepID=A0A1J4JH71_9EUKA|nr:thymidine kinase family protein [Tritrichomonas foetus]|eukprot:OHS96612.1 thymidine kinase family protein [Tritrichomonas foetus]